MRTPEKIQIPLGQQEPSQEKPRRKKIQRGGPVRGLIYLMIAGFAIRFFYVGKGRKKRKRREAFKDFVDKHLFFKSKKERKAEKAQKRGEKIKEWEEGE